MTKSYVMQVAEAVRDACAKQASNYPDVEGWIQNINLPTVIASVPGVSKETVNKKLLGALKDLMQAALIDCSCQYGVIYDKCMCRNCALVRADKAVAAAEQQPVTARKFVGVGHLEETGYIAAHEAKKGNTL